MFLTAWFINSHKLNNGRSIQVAPLSFFNSLALSPFGRSRRREDSLVRRRLFSTKIVRCEILLKKKKGKKMTIKYFNMFLQICRSMFLNELTQSILIFIVLMALVYMLRKVLQQ